MECKTDPIVDLTPPRVHTSESHPALDEILIGIVLAKSQLTRTIPTAFNLTRSTKENILLGNTLYRSFGFEAPAQPLRGTCPTNAKRGTAQVA